MNDILRVFASLSRIKLMLCLKNKEKNVSQLIKTCGLSQLAVSQHLAKLKKWGLIDGEKKGKEIYYRLKSKKTISICENLYKFVKKTL
ncbi:MAG: hypothetical protein KatS3mg092_0328 [Patescibacteria group bacterium]|nr:MAG: hypothetical protein KatS3mg092_0328 [Patescibacteria group bacterium]